MTMLQKGYRRVMSRVARGMADRYLRPRVRPQTMPTACMNCGCREAILVDTPIDFKVDLSQHKPSLALALTEHRDGVCANCGMYQAYRRIEPEDLRYINSVGKDILTEDEVYHGYPVPERFVESFHENTVALQIPRWRALFAELGIHPARVLFIRHWFGVSCKFLHDEYGAEVSGIDMSAVCRRHVAEHHPYVMLRDGSINGMLDGPFLDSGPYDLVATSHVLTHASDIRDMLSKLHGLLRDGGWLVVDAETKVAPTNPFHQFYPSEFHVHHLLSDYFKVVLACTQDGPIRDYDPHRYRGDIVEFFAQR